MATEDYWADPQFERESTRFLRWFRTKFRQPLKDLFKPIGRIAMMLGLIRLGEVAFDATRMKANNSRYQTRPAKTLQEKLQALDELFDDLMRRLDEVNERAAALPSVDRIEETFGQWPERFLTDAGNNSGQIMAGMAVGGDGVERDETVSRDRETARGVLRAGDQRVEGGRPGRLRNRDHCLRAI